MTIGTEIGKKIEGGARLLSRRAYVKYFGILVALAIAAVALLPVSPATQTAQAELPTTEYCLDDLQVPQKVGEDKINDLPPELTKFCIRTD